MSEFRSEGFRNRDPSIDDEYKEVWKELLETIPRSYDREAIRSIVEACSMMSGEEMVAVSVLLRWYNAWLDGKLFVDGPTKCDDELVTRRELLYG